MPECWFASLPDAGPCDGRLVRCHLLPRQLIVRTVHSVSRLDGYAAALPTEARLRAVSLRAADVCLDRRCWVYGCGGPVGPGGHHGMFKPDGPRGIPCHRLPVGLEDFAGELGLTWWLDRTYGVAL